MSVFWQSYLVGFGFVVLGWSLYAVASKHRWFRRRRRP